MADRVYTADRVLVVTNTTGTGAYALAAAVGAAFRTIGQAGGVAGRRYMYTVQDSLSAPSEFEEGEGIFAAGPPETLSRDAVRASSNSGMAVNWGPGPKYLYLSIHADRAAILDTEGRLPVAQAPAGRMSKVRRTTGFSLPDATEADFPWDTADVNTLGVYAGGGPYGQFVIQEPGLYDVRTALSFDANPTGQRRITILVNSAILAAGRASADTADVDLSCTMHVPLSTGDVVKVQAYQNSGGSLFAGGNNWSCFSIAKIGG